MRLGFSWPVVPTFVDLKDNIYATSVMQVSYREDDLAPFERDPADAYVDRHTLFDLVNQKRATRLVTSQELWGCVPTSAIWQHRTEAVSNILVLWANFATLLLSLKCSKLQLLSAFTEQPTTLCSLLCLYLPVSRTSRLQVLFTLPHQWESQVQKACLAWALVFGRVGTRPGWSLGYCWHGNTI